MYLLPSIRQRKAKGLFISILLGKAPVLSVIHKSLGGLLMVATEETGALRLEAMEVISNE